MAGAVRTDLEAGRQVDARMTPADQEILFVAPCAGLSEHKRLGKIIEGFARRGYSIEQIVWPRTSQELAAEQGKARSVVLQAGGGYASATTKLMYITWFFRVLTFFLTKERCRSSFVYLYGFETALPFFIVQGLFGRRFLYDEPDRTSLVFHLPPPVRAFVALLENWVAAHARVHIVPGWSRYPAIRSNMALLPNAPTQRQLSRARLSAQLRVGRDARLTVYANGLLSMGRGMGMLLRAAQLVDPAEVTFLCAGQIADELAARFVALPNVEYLGELNQEAALSWYESVDVCCTFYDPAVAINRFAEPNKWWDCIMFLVPPIINQGIRTASALGDRNACFLVSWNDGDELAKLLNNLARDRQLIREKKDGLERMRGHATSVEAFIDAIVEKVQ